MVQMISKEKKKKEAKKIVKNKPQKNFYSSGWCDTATPAQTNQREDRKKPIQHTIYAQHTHKFFIRIKN